MQFIISDAFKLKVQLEAAIKFKQLDLQLNDALVEL